MEGVCREFLGCWCGGGECGGGLSGVAGACVRGWMGLPVAMPAGVGHALHDLFVGSWVGKQRSSIITHIQYINKSLHPVPHVHMFSAAAANPDHSARMGWAFPARTNAKLIYVRVEGRTGLHTAHRVEQEKRTENRGIPPVRCSYTARQTANRSV